MPQLSSPQKRQVNALADTYYTFHGHISRPEYDFSTATHPQEWLCYAMAKEAHTALLPKPGHDEVRTPRQIVDQTNRLADKFYTLHGHISRPAFNFREARHPQEQLCWRMAAEAQLAFTDTDVDDAISELED